MAPEQRAQTNKTMRSKSAYNVVVTERKQNSLQSTARRSTNSELRRNAYQYTNPSAELTGERILRTAKEKRDRRVNTKRQKDDPATTQGEKTQKNLSRYLNPNLKKKLSLKRKAEELKKKIKRMTKAARTSIWIITFVGIPLYYVQLGFWFLGLSGFATAAGMSWLASALITLENYTPAGWVLGLLRQFETVDNILTARDELILGAATAPGEILIYISVVIIFAIGLITMVVAAFIYTFSFIDSLGGYKLIIFIVCLTFYTTPLLNLIPWALVWMLVVVMQSKKLLGNNTG